MIFIYVTLDIPIKEYCNHVKKIKDAIIKESQIKDIYLQIIAKKVTEITILTNGGQSLYFRKSPDNVITI